MSQMTHIRARHLSPGDMFFDGSTTSGGLATCVYAFRDDLLVTVGFIVDGALAEREYVNSRLIYIVNL